MMCNEVPIVRLLQCERVLELRAKGSTTDALSYTTSLGRRKMRLPLSPS